MLSMIVPVLLGLATQVSTPRDKLTSVAQAQAQLHTPDEIAPAVLPYLACLYAARGLPLLRGSDGSQISFRKEGNDCSLARSRAHADAVKLLEHKKTPGDRTATEFVEEALSEMDH